MSISPADTGLSAMRKALDAAFRADEQTVVEGLLAEATFGEASRARIRQRARNLVAGVRKSDVADGGLDAFLQEYELSNAEGVTLMCLAEALLRVPDAETANRLIKDKIGEADWEKHLGHSRSLFVNASTWALMLTGRVVHLQDDRKRDMGGAIRRMVTKSGEPVIRQAMMQAMKILGRQFVLGRTIEEALGRAKSDTSAGARYSFDMLGEGALTQADADMYCAAYADAIHKIGAAAKGAGIIEGPGVSVKLSALHPRYEFLQRHRVQAELVPKVVELARLAKQYDIGFCIDAEEADRLDLSLDVIEAVSGDPALAHWNGLGLALQAYQKRAPYVIDWLAQVAKSHGRRFMVRLVKGAYWDTEIKRSQEEGQVDFPVFTRKASTDVSYLACAKKIMGNPAAFYPQFATHNAHTIAAVQELAGTDRDFEFQRLHGMGEPLYTQVVADGTACRIYAPVGTHEDLLAYLVRRLLENGANTSFVNRIVDEDAPIEEIIADPCETVRRFTTIRHPNISLPLHLYGDNRLNARGVDMSSPATVSALYGGVAEHSGPWTAGVNRGQPATIIVEPRNLQKAVGTVYETTPEQLETALELARKAAPGWNAVPAEERALRLEKAADLLEENRDELIALCVREAGKTLADSIPELREAVDFLRYYAQRARADFGSPEVMPGPTGETNTVSLHGRGVFACISPWNFPLAIFIGQVSAALVAGNAVIAKPAEQTPLIAAKAVDILYQAGIPRDVIQLVIGDGPTIGAPLVADARINGVVFTGSTATARLINLSLAGRAGAFVPFIAETGGQNVMIVDSTALPEQVVKDAVFSAFRSAGQRCSALRVMFVQDDIADRVIDMLSGAARELSVGDPELPQTDVGPVIDADALQRLKTHCQEMDNSGHLICRSVIGSDTANGSYFAPCAYEISDLGLLKEEIFGPVLHVIRFPNDGLDQVLEAVRNTGFGLTMGIHSRIEATHHYIQANSRVGNTYVNRNMIGAVVGVQPFGGEGLSGTGPKAGGPRYLHRFAVERTLTVNTTAAGGNAALMTLSE
ncbi:MAG: bifunctional proline dehydrogenase/L-glutamate gamma-semialdehyde dehydrogenase PutA [Rhodospirillales bacterium]|nr:bifunctional proline dehydrogenase/L-glutamate gamma-semialdehyde dehydrogenase PutA [Rhodospirillales bacterium]